MKLIAIPALMFVAAASNAATLYFTAKLDEAQEVVDTGSPVTGEIDFRVDEATLTITMGQGTLSQAFATPITLFHIHQAPLGVNGPVRVDLGPGSFSGLNISFSGQTLTQPVLDDMKLGNTYFNIHTQAFGAGEIRGQISQTVPEPATMALLGLGALALRRRRK
jgi:hypothetical protein